MPTSEILDDALPTEAAATPDTPSQPIQAGTRGIKGAVAATEGGGPATEEESSLPRHWHDAYRLRLAGEGVSNLAERFKVDRTTIWRWISRVEEEAAKQLATEPIFNIISREVARLTDLEAQSRAAALNLADDAKAKIGHLDLARRCCMARTSLLLRIGLLPALPEKVFNVINDNRPMSMLDEPAETSYTREEVIQTLIASMTKARMIQ
jgi:hypothetical protein